jgi:phage shock protein A
LALRAFADAWAFIRKIDELLQLQAKMRTSLNVVADRLDRLEGRMTRLEAEQGQVITEARSAATAAATMIASGVVSDTVTRLTRLEGRFDQAESRRLPPSAGRE